MKNDKHVIAVFDNRAKAQNAVDTLVQRDIDPTKLSLLVSENGRDHHFHIDEDKSKTAEGAGYGAALGGMIAGLGAVAAGLVSVTIPGALLVAGPLGVALASGAVGAAAGGLTGALIGMGIPADEVSLVESDLKEGSFLVAAHSINSDEETTAKEVFKDAGAVRVH